MEKKKKKPNQHQNKTRPKYLLTNKWISNAEYYLYSKKIAEPQHIIINERKPDPKKKICVQLHLCEVFRKGKTIKTENKISSCLRLSVGIGTDHKGHQGTLW